VARAASLRDNQLERLGDVAFLRERDADAVQLFELPREQFQFRRHQRSLIVSLASNDERLNAFSSGSLDVVLDLSVAKVDGAVGKGRHV
jgi:hypothetical protein